MKSLLPLLVCSTALAATSPTHNATAILSTRSQLPVGSSCHDTRFPQAMCCKHARGRYRSACVTATKWTNDEGETGFSCEIKGYDHRECCRAERVRKGGRMKWKCC